jgi:tetratricopeptide (TPR) repeat protein
MTDKLEVRPTSPTSSDPAKNAGRSTGTRDAPQEGVVTVAVTRGAVPPIARDAPQGGIVTVAIAEAQAALDSAQAHLDAGDLEAALSQCDAALQSAPLWAAAHNLRGIVLDELGRATEAIASYQEALRLDPALADAAANLAEAQAELRPPPRSKKVALVALPALVLLVVAVTFAVLEARRGPDWRLTLNEYIEQSQQAWTVQSTAAASRPAGFVPTMGRLMPGGVQWEGINPVFPPRAVQCAILATSDGGSQLVYVAYHSDGLHHLGWRVYEAQRAPFTPQLQADLQAIGCGLNLD